MHRVLENGELPPNYRLLAPLNHRACVSIDVARDYIKRLRALALNNWYPEQKPDRRWDMWGLRRLLAQVLEKIRMTSFRNSWSRISFKW